jgi:hypothetical protein
MCGRCNLAFVLRTSIFAHCLVIDVEHKIHNFGEIVSFEEVGFCLPRCSFSHVENFLVAWNLLKVMINIENLQEAWQAPSKWDGRLV